MTDWATTGYEHLELSTQRVVAAALSRGIQVEVLDASQQWLRLTKGDHQEIIRQGNETSADSYVTSLILGDKFIQKKLLSEVDVSVPAGEKFDVIPELDTLKKYQSGKWVIKPLTTNYGIGIEILEDSDAITLQQAIKRSFEYDKSVLIEAFIPGIECRFLVIGGKTRAVLHRVPANVVGDGKHTIEELVSIKNDDPRRGQGYKTPLEKIQLGEPEIKTLAEQDLTINDTSEADKIIWLRQNSNISTGGDSLDYTDIVHPDYSQVAEKASDAVGAQICGVDMMLSDHTAAPKSDNHAIIELNYNPVLYFHDFPYQGKNRDVAPHVLNLLGF